MAMTDKPLTNAEVEEILEACKIDSGSRWTETRLARALLADRAAFKALHDSYCRCMVRQIGGYPIQCEAAERIRGWEGK